MSDTTTITPEERARLREQADKSYLLPLDEDEVPSVGFDGLTDDRIAYIAAACNSVPRLLTALDAAEARADRAEKELAGADAEVSSLRDQLTDCECANREAPRILCDIARLVDVYDQCQELGDDIGGATIEAVQTLIDEKRQVEAERARLRAERDWLAGRCAEIVAEDENYPDSREQRVATWKEAARRAVAAGEGE